MVLEGQSTRYTLRTERGADRHANLGPDPALVIASSLDVADTG